MLYLRSRLVNGSPRKWLGRDPRRAKWRFRVIYGDFSATGFVCHGRGIWKGHFYRDEILSITMC
ncbi:hypothetical protein KC19_3G185200 [Ceratodon purpureus]|uniref:Uncharacterized protein n=1 Tax=Ceratodon purpureus TaxID=3225 RepID=A0A8T0IM54_CERPU|nr:hypothetical protein KC19_3G185200 [Ceratodon purpureus]